MFESLIATLHNWRRDKLALTALLVVMGGDSVTEAWARLDDVLPVMRELDERTRKGRRKDKLDLDHDLCERVRRLAEEVEPWMHQLAERETATA